MLLGREFGHFFSKDETLLWATLSRAPVQYLPNGLISALAEFTCLVCLPLEKSMDLIVTHKLDSETFEFCEGLPVNLSLNARSAALFYQYSQTLAKGNNKDNFGSDFWLFTFRLEVAHIAELRESGSLGLWNRLYVDYLTTVRTLTFTNLEWSTLRCWTFGMSIGDFADALNAEFLSNSNPLITWYSRRTSTPLALQNNSTRRTST